MALSFKPGQLCRIVYAYSRNYCDKSIYQRHEEGEKTRIIHGQPYPEWRKPWIKREDEFKSKLSVFIEKNPSPHVLNVMSQLPDLNLQKVKDWWSNIKVLQEIENQIYLPKRVSTLGANLAAVHFFTHRESAVRLKGSKEWIAGDITTLNLPDRYVDGYIVEAVDCERFHHNGIRYEGLQNLMNLKFLKWLSLKNNKHVDVWCLDRIAGQNGDSLEFLDISGCKLCVGCMAALNRMHALKFLVITDPGDDVHLQTAVSMLEEERPQLLIKAIGEEDTCQDTRK